VGLCLYRPLQSQLDYYGDYKDTEQAIVDIAVEYGLVTDYTSMIVVEETVFQSMNIDRNNQHRVETEHKAREERNAQPDTNNRVYTQQPMLKSLALLPVILTVTLLATLLLTLAVVPVRLTHYGY
jgi:Ca-activated chloride channel family protein